MITMKNIIREGHQNLNKVANPVKLPLSEADEKTLNQMMEFVMNSQNAEIAEKYSLRPAVGLAAPQINNLKRMFAIYFADLDGLLYQMAMINPVIINHSEELIYLPGGEGCLSVDREAEGITPRYEWIDIEGHMLDIPSQKVFKIAMRLNGYASIVFQHEYDHLDGILFTSKEFADLPNAKPAFNVECEIDNDKK